MAASHQLESSRRRLLHLACHKSSPFAPLKQRNFSRTWRRQASSTAPAPNKQIVLEQPDKFRPPSHAQRLVRGRGRPNTFGSGYNQSSTPKEQEAQKTRRYPHTFPNEGTVMHKFLTNRKWHLFITLVCHIRPSIGSHRLTLIGHSNLSRRHIPPRHLPHYLSLRSSTSAPLYGRLAPV